MFNIHFTSNEERELFRQIHKWVMDQKISNRKISMKSITLDCWKSLLTGERKIIHNIIQVEKPVKQEITKEERRRIKEEKERIKREEEGRLYREACAESEKKANEYWLAQGAAYELAQEERRKQGLPEQTMAIWFQENEQNEPKRP
jgi:hypothetical protein